MMYEIGPGLAAALSEGGTTKAAFAQRAYRVRR